MPKLDIRKYPEGPLTRQFVIEYVPGTARELTDEEFKDRYPGTVRPRKNSLSSYLYMHLGDWTPETHQRWDDLVGELCDYYKVPRHNWIGLAMGLMYHHLPALQFSIFKPRGRGRAKTSPFQHQHWIELYQQVRAEKGPKAHDSDIYRAMAKRMGVNEQNGGEMVKGYVRRAIAWRESEQKTLGGLLGALGAALPK